MQHRQVPPARASPSQWVISNPRGADQWRMCSGSTQAWKTRLRGASKTRVMTSSGSFEPVRDSLLSAGVGIALLLPVGRSPLSRLEAIQILVEPIEALLPVGAVALGPVGHFLQRSSLQLARPPLRFTPAGDQPRALQDAEVLGDRRAAHREGRGELLDRGRAANQAVQDR